HHGRPGQGRPRSAPQPGEACRVVLERVSRNQQRARARIAKAYCSALYSSRSGCTTCTPSFTCPEPVEGPSSLVFTPCRICVWQMPQLEVTTSGFARLIFVNSGWPILMLMSKLSVFKPKVPDRP